LPSPNDADASLKKHREERYEVFTPKQREAIAAYLLEWSRSDPDAIGVDDVPSVVKKLLKA
jgi:hypothetical protein